MPSCSLWTGGGVAWRVRARHPGFRCAIAAPALPLMTWPAMPAWRSALYPTIKLGLSWKVPWIRRTARRSRVVARNAHHQVASLHCGPLHLSGIPHDVRTDIRSMGREDMVVRLHSAVAQSPPTGSILVTFSAAAFSRRISSIPGTASRASPSWQILASGIAQVPCLRQCPHGIVRLGAWPA